MLIMSRPLGIGTKTLDIYEDGNEYILLEGECELARASGEQALSMITNYYNYYYNISKHMLYPEMPYPMSKLNTMLEENGKLIDELEEKYAHLDPAEKIKKS